MNRDPRSMLRLIGYWRSDHEPEWPDVRKFVDPTWDAEERRLVALYLDGAVDTPWSYAGYSDCRFCGEWNGTGEKSDGI